MGSHCHRWDLVVVGKKLDVKGQHRDRRNAGLGHGMSKQTGKTETASERLLGEHRPYLDFFQKWCLLRLVDFLITCGDSLRNSEKYAYLLRTFQLHDAL